MTTLSNDDLARLSQWDTPTICNALEVVVPHRRASGFTTEHLHCLELPAAVDLLVRREAVILEVARGDGFDIDKLKRAMSDSADIH